MFKLAELFVSVVAETSSLDRALSRTHANLSTANVALGTFAGNIAASFARMAVGAAGGLFEATVRSASHLNESVNKANVLFDDSAKIITGHAQAMADMWSEPKQSVMDMTNKFALMGREIGYSKEEAAEFGVKVSKMALDARSLGDAETAAMKIEAALAGQSRPLRSLGVFINAATVKAEAARMGLKPEESTGQLSEGSKIKARMSLIENSEFMQKAAGDLARTFQETEGQTRAFWGALSNLATSVGEELNPAWNKLLQSFNTGLADLKGYFEANRSMVRGWGDAVVEGFDTVMVVWRNLPDVLEIAMLGVDQILEDVLATIEQWATQAAVYIEVGFLEGLQSVGDFFNELQKLAAKSMSYMIMPAQYLLTAFDTAFARVSDAWDFMIGKMAKVGDFLFRPIRDAANAIERAFGVKGKQMTVEEDINRLQGALGFVKRGGMLGTSTDFFKAMQDSLAEQQKAKPTDFTSSLIDKANKHLADTLAENTDVSTGGIAAATARIQKREADRLDAETATRNEQYLTDEFAKMFPGTPKAGPGKGRGRGKAGGEGDEGDEGPLAARHTKEKQLMDTASFATNLIAGNLGGDVQDKQLTELQQIRAIDQKNADMMEKMLLRPSSGVFA